MTDTVTAALSLAQPHRRGLLALLCSRAERGVLEAAEGPLLRALVAAEQADTDDLRGQLHLVDGMRQNNLDAGAAAVQRAEQAEQRAAMLERSRDRWKGTAAAVDTDRERIAAELEQAEAHRDRLAEELHTVREKATTYAEQAETRAEQLHATLTDVLRCFAPVEVNGAVAFHQATEHPIAPDDFTRWTAALHAPASPQPDPGDRLARVTAALTAEHYRRAEARTVASPEEHSAAMAAVALAALDGEQAAEPKSSHCTCAGVGFGTGDCAIHYPPTPVTHRDDAPGDAPA